MSVESPSDPPLDRSVALALENALPPRRTLTEEHRIARVAELQLLSIEHPEFPPGLREIHRVPPFLYRKGPRGPDRPVVAVVGSRRASAAGERFAFRLGRELAEAGWRVVSGLARGIDRAVIEGADAGGGTPWAVLGNGLPSIYPPEHADLAERLVAGGGALFSEFPCRTPPRRSHFPRRNRLISALSSGVVVVQATERSGSLITAGWALEQGREVMAVPGPSDGPGHQGCHRLIRDGATLVTSTEEVIEALTGGSGAAEQVSVALREEFAAGERDLGHLFEKTGLPVARLLEGWRRLLDEERAALPPTQTPTRGSADEIDGVS
jgi:DNA processing protein